MHDIDHVHVPRETDDADLEQCQGGASGSDHLVAYPFMYEEFADDDAENHFSADAETLFSETDEMELAAELLEVTDETGLEKFLGRLTQRASRAAGRVIPSSAGRAIGDILKGAARLVLPAIGSAVGCDGAEAGSRSAAATGRLFGLELEGLSGEDQEFEVARGFIRFAGGTIQNLASLAGSQDPRRTAKKAAMAAARMHAPGLIRQWGGIDGKVPLPLPSASRSGRWMRRGNRIILYGV